MANTSGAVHLTSIDLDISVLRANIATVTQEFNDMADKAVNDAERIRDAFNNLGLNGFGGVQSNVVADLQPSIEAVQQLNLRYQELLNNLSRSNIPQSAFGDLSERINNAANAMSKLNDIVLSSGQVTTQNANELQNLSRIFISLSAEVQKAETNFNNIHNSLQRMQDGVTDSLANLTNLHKRTRDFEKIREIDRLSNDFQQLANDIANNNGYVDELRRRFESLQDELRTLSGTIPNTGHALNNFADSILNFAGGKIGGAIRDNITNAIGQIIPTIVETENAVIELKRVISEPISNNVMSDALYDIAYQYGQTFENVSETATKFAQTGMSWSETLEATRSAMLGLNTAELDTKTATEGLIAVMSQFGIDASQLEVVIDKINKTADNFPVTSEKIIQALQRTGGAAQASGMSLEQTIALITSLSEATGRAGANLGTAMNSLISFTTNESAIKTFEEFLNLQSGELKGANPFETWSKLGDAITGNVEATAEMMAQSKEFAGLFNSEVAEAINLTGQYNEAVRNGEDVYKSAGTYRKTYFIALLNNISTAREALLGMADAEGYSLQENEIAMNTLTAKWNQFVSSLQQLAVQLGESGLVDFLKGLTDLAIAIVKVTEALGGLKVALPIVLTALVAFGRVKVAETFSKIGTAIVTLPQAFTAVGRAAIAATPGVTGFGVAMSAALPILSLIATGVSILTSVIQGFAQRAQEARQEITDLSNKSGELAQVTKQAEKSYEDLKKSIQNDTKTEKELTEEKQKMVDAAKEATQMLEEEQDTINAISDAFLDGTMPLEQYVELMDELIEKANKLALDNIRNEIKTTTEELSGFIFSSNTNPEDGITTAYTKDLFDIPEATLEKNAEIYRQYNNRIKELEEERLQALINGEKDYAERIQENIDWYKKEISAADEKIKLLKDAVIAGLRRNKVDEDAIAILKLFLPEEEKLIDALVESAQKSKIASEGVGELGDSVEETAEKIKALNSEIDSFQSAMSTLQSVVDEYNSTGMISIDNLQKLLEMNPQYLSALEMVNGQLSLNAEKIDATKYNLEQQATQQLYNIMIANNLTDSLGWLFGAESNVATGAGNVATMSSIAGSNMSNASGGAYVFQRSLDMVAGSAVNVANKIYGVAQSAAIVSNMLGRYYASASSGLLGVSPTTLPGNSRYGSTPSIELPTINWNAAGGGGGGGGSSGGGGGSSGGGGATDVFKEMNDALKEELEILEHEILLMEKNGATAEKVVNKYNEMQQKVSRQANKFRAMGLSDESDYIRELQKKWWDYYEKKLEAMKKEVEEENEILEHQNYLNEKNMGDPKERIANYRAEQQNLHELANKYRKMGLSENSEYIRELQKQWWELDREIKNVYESIRDTQADFYDTEITFRENQFLREEQELDTQGRLEALYAKRQEAIDAREAAHKRANEIRANPMYDPNNAEWQKLISAESEAYFEYARQVKEIDRQIQEVMLTPFNRFIDLADEFDLWNELDFTKIDYLQDKMRVINELFANGQITVKDYTEYIKTLGSEMLNAYKEDIEKQKANIEKYYKDRIESYNKEIEQWNKRKEESDKYYDDLIENLNTVEESNERINQQLDYYNERQKIITNLEQARARSGVAWREKEMEYQQQLIDLDKKWGKTVSDWNIQDQISELQELKEQAAKDIDETISKIQEQIKFAEKASEEAIKALEKQVENLATRLATAIANGMRDGLIDTDEEFNDVLTNSFNELQETINDKGYKLVANIFETAAEGMSIYSEDFIDKVGSQWGDLQEYMHDAIASGAMYSAKAAFEQYKHNLIDPLKEALQTAYTPPRAPSNFYGMGSSTYRDSAGNDFSNYYKPSTMVYITNNNASSSTRNFRTQNAVQNILQR